MKDELSYSNAKFNKLNSFIHLYSDSIEYNGSIIRDYKALIKVFQKYKVENSLMMSYANLGFIYRKVNKFDLAIQYLQKAINNAKKRNKIENLEIFYKQLIVVYELKKDYVNAFNYSKEYMIIHDSLYQVSQSIVIAELQTKYETQKKENENVLLKKDAKIKDQELLLKDKDIEEQKQSKYFFVRRSSF